MVIVTVVALVIILVLLLVRLQQIRKFVRHEWWASMLYYYRKDNLARRFKSREVLDKELGAEAQRLDKLSYPHKTVKGRYDLWVHRFLMTRWNDKHGFKFPYYSEDKHPLLWLFNKLESVKYGGPYPEWLLSKHSIMELRFYTMVMILFKPIAILQYYTINKYMSLEYSYRYRWFPNPNQRLQEFSHRKYRWIDEILEYRKLCSPLSYAKRGPDSGLMYFGDKLKSDWMFFATQSQDEDILSKANFIALKREIDKMFEKDPSLEDQWDIESFNGNYNPEHIILQVFADEDLQRLTPLPLAVWAFEEIKPKLDSYPIIDEELFSNMETMASLDMLQMSGEDFIDTDKMPKGTDWDAEELYHTGDGDMFPNDSKRPYWVYELSSVLNDSEYEGQYGDSGREYQDSDVAECIYRLGWVVDEEDLRSYAMSEFKKVDKELPRLVKISDPDDFEQEESKYRWYGYFPEDELATTGDGKYYSPEYFEAHIQSRLI